MEEDVLVDEWLEVELEEAEEEEEEVDAPLATFGSRVGDALVPLEVDVLAL